MRRNGVVVALVVWTFLVWTTRFGTIWSDDGLDTTGKLGRTALALSFTLLATGVAVAAWRAEHTVLRTAVAALAGWTTAVWIVRSVGIVLADHTASFTIVHLVLAVVSIGLSALAIRSLSGELSATG